MRSAGSRSRTLRRCINSVCQPVPFARLFQPDPGDSRSFASETRLVISYSLTKDSPKQMPVQQKNENRKGRTFLTVGNILCHSLLRWEDFPTPHDCRKGTGMYGHY